MPFYLDPKILIIVAVLLISVIWYKTGSFTLGVLGIGIMTILTSGFVLLLPVFSAGKPWTTLPLETQILVVSIFIFVSVLGSGILAKRAGSSKTSPAKI